MSPSLQRKLNKKWMEQNVSDLTDAVSNGILWNIKEYGVGVARTVAGFPHYKGEYDRAEDTSLNNPVNPTGGAPIWQGVISEPGHYRGYLSESHYIKKINSKQSYIATPAEFVWGVIYGYSTNEDQAGNRNITFPPNPYHKRAVDNYIASGKTKIIWSNIINR